MKHRLTGICLAALLLLTAVLPARAADPAVFSFTRDYGRWNTGTSFTSYTCGFTLATGPYGGKYTMTFPYGDDVQTFTAEPDSVYSLTYAFRCTSSAGSLYDHYVTVAWSGPGEGLSGAFNFTFTGPGHMAKSLTGLKVTLVSQGGSGPTPANALGSPTELTWGKNYDYYGTTYKERTDAASWKPAEKTDRSEQFSVWRLGETEPVYTITYSNISLEQTYITWEDFIGQGLWQTSGDYYFPVQEKSKSEDYADGPVVRSEIWSYTKPADQLKSPVIEALTQRQKGGGYALLHLSLGSSADDPRIEGYRIRVYRPDSEYQLSEAQFMREYAETDGEGRIRISMSDWFTKQYGSGDYIFRICAFGDINRVQPSEWSQPYTFSLTQGAGGEWMEAPPEACWSPCRPGRRRPASAPPMTIRSGCWGRW